jgi:hypothetical protein
VQQRTLSTSRGIYLQMQHREHYMIMQQQNEDPEWPSCLEECFPWAGTSPVLSVAIVCLAGPRIPESCDVVSDVEDEQRLSDGDGDGDSVVGDTSGIQTPWFVANGVMVLP